MSLAADMAADLRAGFLGDEVGGALPDVMRYPPSKLAGKLAKVAASIGPVPKSGKNTEHGYDYSTETDIVTAVRGALFGAGVMLFPEVMDVQRTDAGKSQGGNSKVLTVMWMQFTFVDSESGESWRCQWVSEAMDTQDKAVAKALTNALKYFLRDTFLLATGDLEDEVDNDGRPTGRKLVKGKSQAPKAAPASRPRADSDANRDAWGILARELRAAKCDVPRSTEAGYAQFISWLRTAFEQALGRDVKKVADLTPADVVAGGKAIGALIGVGALEPWKAEA